MKTKILLTLLSAGLVTVVSAQKPVMTLTFTAENNGQYVPLESILIENLTQGGDTTLYAPDTVLLLKFFTGYGENISTGDKGLTIFQNYPNPMQGKTTFNLHIPDYENVRFRISDIMGRELINQKFSLEPGGHTFVFMPGSENIYFLTAATDHEKRSVKMFNSPYHTSSSGVCKLEYCGKQDGKSGFKSGKELNGFVFNLGDMLQLTGSSNFIKRTTIDSPTIDTNYIFQFSALPCPGTPTVTDIDGNVYNTVLIGNQCWTAENLKTTTYLSGMAIPNVTNNNTWGNLTTGAYCWYDNDISWKCYGALYNWYATVDAHGLCPSGWHVPTDNEWYSLTDYLGGEGEPHGNELKSCWQVNSPLGGECNTSEHPRWDANSGSWGTDDYGFSGLPGGRRSDDGIFSFVGYYGHWWSSTEYSSNDAWFRGLINSYGNVLVVIKNKQFGLNIRCLKD